MNVLRCLAILMCLVLAGPLAAQTTAPATTGEQMKGPTFWMPEQAAVDAPKVDMVFDFITYLCYFFFVLIVVLLFYFSWKYRRKSHHDKAEGDVTHNTPLELTWTIIPLILVIAIFYVGMEGYLNLRTPPIGAYEVNVTAQQWSWNFAHRSGCSEPGVLRVPLGKPVRLVMRSADVLHALYIPVFRVKQDIVPGRVTDLWFTPTKAGTFDLYCAEYCGKDHSQMLAHVIVYATEEEFEAAMAECADWAKDTPDAELADAAFKRIYPRCSSCHSLDGKDGTGPTWRGLWDKVRNGEEMFTDGTSLADHMGPGKQYATPEDYLRDSILNPSRHIVERFTNAMPTFKGQLKEREITAIIEFIKHLDEFDNAGNRIKPASGAETAPAATPAS